MWPPEDPFGALLRVIEVRLGKESNEENRSKLQKLRDGLVSLGREVGTGALSGILVEGAGAFIR